MNKVFRFVRSPRAALSSLALAAGSANAALDASITSAIDTAKSDAATLGAAVLVAIVIIFSIKLLRRAL